MEIVKISLYEKEKETGILENLLGTYMVEEGSELLEKAYVINNEGLKVHLYLTVLGEIEDDEYEAIFESYEGEGFEDINVTIEEVEDGYNPTWMFEFDFLGASDEMEELISDILAIHKDEVERIIKKIRG